MLKGVDYSAPVAAGSSDVDYMQILKRLEQLEEAVLGDNVEIVDVRPVIGELWYFPNHDSILTVESSEEGAKRAAIPVESGMKYRITVSATEGYTQLNTGLGAIAAAEAIIVNDNYTYNGGRVAAKSGTQTFDINPGSSTNVILINSCGPDSEIIVYKIKA